MWKMAPVIVGLAMAPALAGPRGDGIKTFVARPELGNAGPVFRLGELASGMSERANLGRHTRLV